MQDRRPKQLYNQDYARLYHECLIRGELFRDPKFLPRRGALEMENRIFKAGIEWMRPWEICSNPQLMVDGSSAYDVIQGDVGDCWLISAMGSVACFPEYMKRVIPDYQEQEERMKNKDKYCGIFLIRLWRYGEWIEIVIDDYLPTLKKKLIFARSTVENEFWCALVEKAYAKLCGCYEYLVAGQEEEGLVDLTGGMPECVYNMPTRVSPNPTELAKVFRLLIRAFDDKAVICGSIGSAKGRLETKLTNGLVTTHAYTITAVKEVQSAAFNHGQVVQILRLRNPWGHKEWNGAFADNSQEWKSVNEEERKQIGLVFANDGEFWMTLKDFCANFDTLTVVQVLDRAEMLKPSFYCEQALGTWIRICNEHAFMFDAHYRLQQFYFVVDPADRSQKNKIPIMLHVLQKLPRSWHCIMGVLLGKVEYNRCTMVFDQSHCKLLMDYKVSGSRCLCFRKKLPRGAYVLIPYMSTAPPDRKPVDYFMRLSSPENLQAQFLPSSLTPRSSGMLAMCSGNNRNNAGVFNIMITRVDLHGGTFLCSDSQMFSTSQSYFCEMECENTTVFTCECADGAKCMWEEAFLFYRSRPNKNPIIVKVFCHINGAKECIAQTAFTYDPHQKLERGDMFNCSLQPQHPLWSGELVISIFHSRSLDDF